MWKLNSKRGLNAEQLNFASIPRSYSNRFAWHSKRFGHAIGRPHTVPTFSISKGAPMRLPPLVKTFSSNRFASHLSPGVVPHGDCDFDCTVCENPCRPLGSCRVCWDDPTCLIRKEDCI